MNAKSVFLSVFLSCILISTTLFGQHQNNMQRRQMMHQECEMFKDLTDAQKKEIKEIKFASHEKISELRADLRIKNAELDKMRISLDVPQNQIDAKINEISNLRAEIMKERVASERAIMEKLSPEQRAKFRMHKNRRPGGSFYKHEGRHSGKSDVRHRRMRADCPFER